MRFFKKIALGLIAIVLINSSLAQAQSSAGAKTPVIATITQTSDFADKIEALGTLRANESVDLTPSVTERITEIFFEDNQRVKKGDILIKMDVSEEVAELAEQVSFMNEAQRQVERLTPLVKQKAASVAVLDENLRELEGAKARYSAIESRISNRVIKAPFDGILGLKDISVGMLAQPGQLITTIDDDSVMKLDFSVPEIFLSTLKKGVIIEASTEAYPEKIFNGMINSVDSRIDPVTRSIQARAIIENVDGLLKPGLLMQVELQKNPRQSLLVPEETVISDGHDNYVFVVNEENPNLKAERRKIKIGSRRLGEAEIIEGLTEGEKIITQGTLRLKDGAAIKILAIEKDGLSLTQLLETSKNKSDVEPKS